MACYIFNCTFVYKRSFPSQQHSPLLHPSTLFVLPQNTDPQLHLPPIFQCTPDLLMYLLIMYALLHTNIICLHKNSIIDVLVVSMS